MASSTVDTDTDTAGHEAPLTLDQPAPKVLSFWDQSAFWANLGVSLFAFSGAYTVLAPNTEGVAQISIAAGILAMIIGTVAGGLMLGLSAIPGAETGKPAMMLLRGLFGARLSYVPTVLNIAQLIGWGTFELIVIGNAAEELFGGGPHWLYVVAAGVITTVLTIWPLGSVRMLRRFVTVGVAIALIWFYVQFFREGLPDLTASSGPDGSGPFGVDWSLFWIATDAALAVSISWVPVAADYTRHSRSTRAAFGAAGGAYALTQIFAYILGLFALALATGEGTYGPFLTVTLGGVFFFVLVVREADQSFANVYSTAVSIQNLAPRVDRRVLSVGLGALITLLALRLRMDDYFGFLGLIGSVFVPLLGVLVADFFLRTRTRGEWNTAVDAPSRWGMMFAWLVGLSVYQLINPGDAGVWTDFWVHVQQWLHFTKQPWMSASLLSFLAAVAAAWLVGRIADHRAGAASGHAGAVADD